MKKLTVEVRMDDKVFAAKGAFGGDEVAVSQGFGNIVDGLANQKTSGVFVNMAGNTIGDWKVEQINPPVEDLIDPILNAFYDLLKDTKLPERLLADAGKEIVKQVSRAIRNLTNPEG